METPSYHVRSYGNDDRLPDEAESLFAKELEYSREPLPADRADRDAWRFACVCAVTPEGHVLGGAHLDIGPINFGPLAKEKLAFVEGVLVRPEYRQCGVGARIMQEAISVAREAARDINVATDSGVYDKVRAFRAPNSRHPKTGLHKRYLSVRELLDLDAEQIVELAREPEPFEIPDPAPGFGDWNMAALWNECKSQFHQQTEAVARRRETGPVGLNRSTLDFICDGAVQGDRHRRLFSAAANLAEFGCPVALAHALLTEAALDSGLPPSQARRQIECGLSHREDGAS